MSQYLTFDLKSRKLFKFLPNIEMGYLCTTPARTISNYAFSYTEEDVKVQRADIEGLKNMLSEYKDRYKSIKEQHYDELKKLLTKAKTYAAAKALIELLDEDMASLADCEECYNEVLGWYKTIRRIYIKSLLLKPFYQLYYTNC